MKKLVYEMLNRARKHQPAPARADLGDGSALAIRFSKGTFALWMARLDGFPMPSEYERAAEAMPEGMVQIGGLQGGRIGDRYCLVGAFQDWGEA